nr:zinc finger protein 26-like [Vanessa tameamea]
MENTEVEDQITLSALKFVCGDNEYVCRLCLSPTNNRYVNIEDTVKLQTRYYENSISYQNILANLNVPEEPLLPQILCKNCAKITINCYLFQQLRQFSMDKWVKVLQLLKNSLSQLDTLKTDTQTAFLILNKTDNLVFTNHKSYEVKPKKVAILKEIMRSCRKYIQAQQKLKECICNECGEKFPTHFLLVKHIKAHNKTHNPCKECPKSFSTPTQLQEHMERVHYPKTLQCDKCSYMSSTLKILKSHENHYHIPAKCKLCNIEFLSRKALRAHLDNHNAKICSLCDKKFLNIHNFKVHINRCGITGYKPERYVCDICNKCYSSKNGLRSHLKTDHGFGKVLSCSWCNKKFDAISRLKDHIVKHTKERNFHCNLCDGQFVTYPALVYHIRLHTGERPFPCDLCDESFLSASRRMEHKKRKHIGPTKACTLCHMKFITSHQLSKHFQRHFNPNSKLFITKADLLELRKAGKQL